MSGNDSRADRLRRRRRQQRDQQADQADPPESSDPSEVSDSSEPSEPSKPTESERTAETGSADEPAETDEREGQTSVKEDQVGTYMYLPEDLRTDLDFRYKELSLAYERAFGEGLEKNRHFYPLVVRAGLERLSELDEDALRERVADIDG